MNIETQNKEPVLKQPYTYSQIKKSIKEKDQRFVWIHGPDVDLYTLNKYQVILLISSAFPYFEKHFNLWNDNSKCGDYIVIDKYNKIIKL